MSDLPRQGMYEANHYKSESLLRALVALLSTRNLKPEHAQI